ncbi:ubiquitin-like domain-containing protein CIP73 isoform X2 [Magnolia sinica]|uniref:ubiquitin-like domain-containing protein CIP73 isoform X2 n=1 Tax=Magnolia sinica TaxID=86752 RepID=UPI002657C687|nr:ubiquitin-like domain-containing protein CIP73 isoform X2 [Magnolia sinica]
MADGSSAEGASSSDVNAESSESTVEVNVKTLDSQIYTFRVNKNIPVSLFKEKIAMAIGVPVGQQRLIFRGKVLKDNHLLSEYHLEDGHTLHLVARQPIQSETLPGTGSGETGGNHDNRGNDSTPGAPRNRVGQISHSVVLGTFNIGDQGEGIVPDLTRIIGAVLNSVGVGNVATSGGASNTPTSANVAGPPSQGVGAEATQGNAGGRSQTGSQVPHGQAFPNVPFQSLHQSLPFPFLGAGAVPSLQTVIPDSLTTLTEFMNRMELALSHNGYQSRPSVNVGDPPGSAIPSSNARGLPAPEVLSTIIRRAQQLLSGPTGAALSNIAGRIEREGGTTDPVTRGQIQAEAMQVGVAMQHLGALLLELGRTILTLRMGQSPAESVVNAGPAVYISPSGPNPIMVQPFPLQSSSLFGASSAAAQASAGISGSIGAADMPRNISIHIHAGTAVAPGISSVGSRSTTGEAAHVGQHPNQAQASVNGTGSVNLGPMHVLPPRNVVAAVPGRSPSDAAGHVLSVFYPLQTRSQQTNPNHTASGQGSNPSVTNGTRPNIGSSVSQPTSQSISPSAVITQVQMRVGSVDGSTQGQLENSAVQGSSIRSSIGGEQNQLLGDMGVDGAGQTGVVVDSALPYNSGASNVGHQPQPSGCQLSNIEDNRVTSSLIQTSSVSSPGDSIEADSSKSSSENNTGTFASENAPSSSQSQEPSEGGKTVPLGLGSGGLQPKRRSKQVKMQGRDGEMSCTTPVNRDEQSIARGQQVLQSLLSRGSDISRTDSNANTNSNGLSVQLPPVFRQIMGSLPLGGQGNNGQIDPASMMSQLLQSPALNSLLEGVSEQAGIESPTGLRSIMEQLAQSPAVSNTLNQIARDVEGQSHNLGNMLLGSGRDPGGIDFSRMFQQLMPVVSQAFGQGSILHAPSHAVESEPPPQRNADRQGRDDRADIDLQEAVERIEGHDSPVDLFRTVVQNAGRLYGENASADLVEEICSNSTLANEFMEMLQRDIRRRLHSESNSSSDRS